MEEPSKEESIKKEWTPGYNKHDLKETFLHYYKVNFGSGSRAAKATKISRSTWVEWKNKDPEFAEALINIEEELVDEAQFQLGQFIRSRKKSPSLTKLKLDSVMYFLNKKGKTRGYGEVPQADGKININIIGLEDEEKGEDKTGDESI